MHNEEFSLILNHSVRIGRRSGYTTTDMGQRRSSGETTVNSGMSCYFYMNSGKKILMPSGDFKIADYTMMIMENLDIQEGDLVYPLSVITGLTIGSVINVEAIMDFDGLTHHVEVHIEKLG